MYVLTDVTHSHQHHIITKPCAEHVGGTARHTNSNADLTKLIVFWCTLQYNPFIFVEDLTKPQIRELDVGNSAYVQYIHIMVEG